MKDFIVKFYHLNRMGRIEGPPLAGLAVLVGGILSNGSLTPQLIIAALLMYLVCMNYVYLVNGVTDIKEDAINSPNRPLANGSVKLKEARIYVSILFIITAIYPFMIHSDLKEKLIVWVILLLGYFYSCHPVRFKRFPPLATIYLVLNFNLPILLGYWMIDTSDSFPPFLLSTSLLFLANMPLKDYGDRVGDEIAGVNNWVKILNGPNNLLLFSSILSIAGCVICWALLPTDMSFRTFFVFLPLVPVFNILIHKSMNLNMDRMFTHGVRSLILAGFIIVVNTVLIS